MKTKMKDPAEMKGKREVFSAKSKNMHNMFRTKGGSKGNPASYLRGGKVAHPPEASGPMEDDAASDRMESDEFGNEDLKDNLGSKRKSGYGDPQGGTTTTVSMPGGDKGDLMDETRGTHEMPKHPYAAKHDVPQEAKERIARALAMGRMRRG